MRYHKLFISFCFFLVGIANTSLAAITVEEYLLNPEDAQIVNPPNTGGSTYCLYTLALPSKPGCQLSGTTKWYRLTGAGEWTLSTYPQTSTQLWEDVSCAAFSCLCYETIKAEVTFDCAALQIAPPTQDSDNDGKPDSTDNCPTTPNPYQEDKDGDGKGDVCDDDIDDDGVANDSDNCPWNANADQKNSDGDDAGNACDSCPSDPSHSSFEDAQDGKCSGKSGFDNDGDGILNDSDNCNTVYNPDQKDLDSDKLGDACDPDVDGDNIPNETCGSTFVSCPDGHDSNIPNTKDNCLTTPNSDQMDTDGNGVGDACAVIDADQDGIMDDKDNCPQDANPDQQDTDGAGKGDVCDDDIDNDGTANKHDVNPATMDDPAQIYWVAIRPQYYVAAPTWPGWLVLKPSTTASPADTDKDGTSDTDELTKYHTNPVKTDTDGDGISDTAEIQSGGNPAQSNAPATIIAIAVTNGLFFDNYDALMSTAIPTGPKTIPLKIQTTNKIKDLGNPTTPSGPPKSMQQKRANP